jgi:hypothetical protein
MEWNAPRSPSVRTITPTIGTIVATRNPLISVVGQGLVGPVTVAF